MNNWVFREVILTTTQSSVPTVFATAPPSSLDHLLDDLDPDFLLPSSEKWWDNDSHEEKEKGNNRKEGKEEKREKKDEGEKRADEVSDQTAI